MSEKILITGAAGFIGFHTAKALLDKGIEIVGIDNLNGYYETELKDARLALLKPYPSFTFLQIDISDKAAMEQLWQTHGPFKKVVHLAAQAGVRYSLENPYTYVQSNCMGHLTVLEMCRHTEGFEHLVYASSSSVYGGNTKVPFAITDEVNNPVSLYAATKRADELMSHTYAHLYGLPQTGLRFFTVYGPWGRPDMAYAIFTKAILEGSTMPVFNHGDMKRDFTYVDDIVSGVLGVLETPPLRETSPHRILNLGNTRSENLMDFIAILEKSLGKKAMIEYKDMQAGDVYATFADISETTELTGFTPITSIEVGLPKYVEWYLDYYKQKSN